MSVRIDTKHPQYLKHVDQWTRARDAYAGGDEVRGKGALYLPPLASMDVQTQDGQDLYSAYLKRALWYNATSRTVDGLSGAVFMKAPEWEGVTGKMEDQLRDVTLTAVPAELFMLLACREVLTTGRAGVLVDMSEDGGQPYWVTHHAENIINWDVTYDGGVPRLSLVVIKQQTRKEPDNPFNTEVEVTYKVLALDRDTGFYVQRKFKETGQGTARFEQDGEDVFPMRRGKRLEFIPWTWLGPVTVESRVQRPPLLDLVDVNFSHYRTTADLEHGLHYVGTPQLVLIGALNNRGAPVKFGSGRAILLPKESDAKILQADGNMMGALENAEQRKRNLMATLGARLLEATPDVQETATAVAARHSGDHATLRTVAMAQEQGFSDVLRTHLWWQGTEADPNDIDASVSLNKDYLAARMTPAELRELTAALQAEAISHETYWAELARGGIARPDVTSEEELEQIEKEAPPESTMPNVPGEPAPGDQGNPYRIENRGGSWVVVKADTGQVVPGGSHGKDQAKAKRHRQALESAAKGE